MATITAQQWQDFKKRQSQTTSYTNVGKITNQSQQTPQQPKTTSWLDSFQSGADTVGEMAYDTAKQSGRVIGAPIHGASEEIGAGVEDILGSTSSGLKSVGLNTGAGIGGGLKEVGIGAGAGVTEFSKALIPVAIGALIVGVAWVVVKKSGGL